MSSGRKIYDGALASRDIGFAKRRNPDVSQGTLDEYASSKRTRKSPKVDELEESPFHESGEKDRYLITYADLITLLLGLFIMLYTASNLDAIKYQNIINAFGNVFGGQTKQIGFNDLKNKIGISDKSGQVEITPLTALKNDVLKLIKDNNYNNSINVEENERGVTIHILEDIVFASGSADLKATSKLVLHQIASIIQNLPNDVRIEGHTDNVPISSTVFPSNWHLSVARALNTAYYLIKNEGLSPDKVSIVGYSEYKPIESNETVSGRAHNRRVDLVIIK